MPTFITLRKEVIQPHLPIRLPCYDFTPVIEPAFGRSVPLLDTTYLHLSTPSGHMLSRDVFFIDVIVRACARPITSAVMSTRGSVTYFGHSQLPWCDGRCVQDPGTYSPRHSDSRLLAIPASCSRVADYNPN